MKRLEYKEIKQSQQNGVSESTNILIKFILASIIIAVMYLITTHTNSEFLKDVVAIIVGLSLFYTMFILSGMIVDKVKYSNAKFCYNALNSCLKNILSFLIIIIRLYINKKTKSNEKENYINLDSSEQEKHKLTNS